VLSTPSSNQDDFFVDPISPEVTGILVRISPMRLRQIGGAALCMCLVTLAQASSAFAQGYGSDLQNVVAPASGGMAGVSVARPQDVPSAIFGNPATMTQFAGTQFTFGGAWIEGYPTISNNGSLNGGTPFSITSRTQGFVIPSVGVTQNFDLGGRSTTVGLGLGGLSGMGAEYRDKAPGTVLNNFSSEYLVLGLNMGLGMELTERLSIGAAMTLGTAFEQLGFVGPIIGSAMVNDYALRGTVGVNYALNDRNNFGVYWQSPMSFSFSDAIRVNGNYQDLRVTQPATLGLGWANRTLLQGRLLIAADVYYKHWSSAALWQDVLVNQWVLALGTQYNTGKYKLRAGYSYNANPIKHSVGSSLDGFPVAQDNVLLFQAGSAPFVNQHRLTFGIGQRGVMVPNLDIDLFAGGMFKASDNFGPNTTASLAVYYAGLGLTWRFGAAAPRPCDLGAACGKCWGL
jgi:long-chain fatty acid transport protein